LILSVKSCIEKMATNLLGEKVKDALSAQDVVKEALMELVKSQKTGEEWAISLGPIIGKPLAKTVVESIFKDVQGKVRIEESLKQAGFELKSGSGAEVIELTEESVKDSFRRLMSQDLAKMLSEEAVEA